jgi:hypothetical protein
MTSACRQPLHTLARPAQNGRSVVRSFGGVAFAFRQLLAHGQVLEGELAVATDAEGNEPEHVE